MGVTKTRGIPDYWWIAGILGFFVILNYRFRNFESLREGLMTGMIGVISILTYRYSVKSNIRTIIGDLKGIQTNRFRITPSVNSVKWRPVVISNWFGWVKFRNGKPFQRSAALNFRTFKTENNSSILSDWEKIKKVEGIDDKFLTGMEEELNNEFENIKINIGGGASGILVHVNTNSGRYLGLIGGTVLKKLGNKLEEAST